MEYVQYLFDGGVSINVLVKRAMSVCGGADRPEVDGSVQRCEVRPDPGDTCGPECLRGDVLYPGKAGEVGEIVDLQKRQLVCCDGVD